MTICHYRYYAGWILALALLPRSATAQIAPEQPIALMDQGSEELVPLADLSECGKMCAQADWARGSACWTARANLVVLQRTRPDSLVLIQDQSGTPETLDAADFHFDYELGWDVSLLGQVAGLPQMEIRFFSVDGWTAQASAEMLTAPIQINTATGDFVNATGTVGASYHSELCSFEANARLPHSERVTWLAGFRYLELDERFLADIPSEVTLDVATRNRLYGAQFGAEAQLWQLGCWSFEGTGKFGLFGNAATHDGVFDTGSDEPEVRSASDGAVAYLIEAGLAAVYPITPRLSLRGAYNVLWLGNVAVATDQVPVSNFVGDTGIDPHGNSFYHGAFVGIEYRH